MPSALGNQHDSVKARDRIRSNHHYARISTWAYNRIFKLWSQIGTGDFTFSRWTAAVPLRPGEEYDTTRTLGRTTARIKFTEQEHYERSGVAENKFVVARRSATKRHQVSIL